MKEGKGTYLDTRPNCTYYCERLAAHVVMQVLHASPHCCHLVLREGLTHAEAQQHCITGSVKRVTDLRQYATKQNTLWLLDMSCFRRLDDSHELCPLRRLEEPVAEEPHFRELGL
jgi:hypothetical protein